MEETRPEQAQRQWDGTQPDEKTQQLIEQLAGLDLGKQLQVLRVIVPELLARLAPGDREKFLATLEDRSVQ